MLTAPQNPPDGLARLRERITIAAKAANRDPSGITLVGVAKAQPLPRIAAALNAVQIAELVAARGWLAPASRRAGTTA